MEELYSVYIMTDSSQNITAINSSAFLDDVSNWVQIDEGIGDKYHHAQGHYLEEGLTDENGCYNYKLVSGAITERTDEEKQADLDSVVIAPSAEERLEAAEAAIIELMEVLASV